MAIGLEKQIMYDWMGANVWLFKQVNAIKGEGYDAAMIFISFITDNHNFPFFVAITVCVALLDYAWRKVWGKGGAQNRLIAWFGAISVFCAAAIVSALYVNHLKSEVAYRRPYVELGKENVHTPGFDESVESGNRSFPSGHATFMAAFIASLWPILTGIQRKLGVLVVFATCWSRMALGLHYPADVLAGVIIGVVTAFVARQIIYWIYLHIFKLKC